MAEQVIFEDQYLALRKKEGRIYSDEELLMLPDVVASHPYFAEWKIRKNSAAKLIRALKRKTFRSRNTQTMNLSGSNIHGGLVKTDGLLQKKEPINILEVGCGNGWLSYQLAQIPNSCVIGADINSEELKQAKRVFSKQKNLRFINGDIRENIFKDAVFDIIVFAASIQYFFPLDEILGVALKHLGANGEIHIIDSFFYPENKVAEAQKRTVDYYNSLGFSQMSSFYFHHSEESLSGFNYSIMNKFAMLYSRSFNREKILPWIMIKKAKSE